MSSQSSVPVSNVKLFISDSILRTKGREVVEEEVEVPPETREEREEDGGVRITTGGVIPTLLQHPAQILTLLVSVLTHHFNYLTYAHLRIIIHIYFIRIKELVE